MNPKYYIAVRPRTNEVHRVHKEGCPFIDCNENTIFLGKFKSGKEAEIAGSMHFENSKCCAFCSKEILKEEETGTLFNFTKMVPEFALSAFLCCIN